MRTTSGSPPRAVPLGRFEIRSESRSGAPWTPVSPATLGRQLLLCGWGQQPKERAVRCVAVVSATRPSHPTPAHGVTRPHSVDIRVSAEIATVGHMGRRQSSTLSGLWWIEHPEVPTTGAWARAAALGVLSIRWSPLCGRCSLLEACGRDRADTPHRRSRGGAERPPPHDAGRPVAAARPWAAGRGRGRVRPPAAARPARG